MTSIVALVALHASLATPASYTNSYAQLMETGQPLVVLVGADWCPGCRTMKVSVAPELRRRGGLDKVGFAIVDTDKHPTLASKLMRGSSIPQLVMYRKTAKGWRRSRLTGAQSTASMEAFIKRGLADAITKPKREEATASLSKGS